MTTLGTLLIGGAAALLLYPYVVYPAFLRILGHLRARSAPAPVDGVEEWPTVSITVPVYNEEGQVHELIESLLALDYPEEKRQILIVSDASSDGTDEIVEEYSDRGIELLRVEGRSGKTAVENAARLHLTGEFVLNTDASIRILPGALKPLVAALQDPEVGVASGCDISIAKGGEGANLGESGYVGYEMWVRELENRVDGIVGASGCLYAIRRDLHLVPVPEALSRDFISALNARERGYRSVSVKDALCLVPRTPSLLREYRRKVRTLTRGMQTLLHKRVLLNPFRFGIFSWMLFSHKMARWLLPWAVLLGGVGLLLLALDAPWARWVAAAVGAGAVLAAVPWGIERWKGVPPALPRPFTLPAYVAAGVLAVFHAQLRVIGQRQDPVWEPTRREGGDPAPATEGPATSR